MEEAKNQVTLLMDTKFSFAVRFPFNPSNINFAELEVSAAIAVIIVIVIVMSTVSTTKPVLLSPSCRCLSSTTACRVW